MFQCERGREILASNNSSFLSLRGKTHPCPVGSLLVMGGQEVSREGGCSTISSECTKMKHFKLFIAVFLHWLGRLRIPPSPCNSMQIPHSPVFFDCIKGVVARKIQGGHMRSLSL